MVLAEGVNIEDFLPLAAQRLTTNLPKYAVPLFIRIAKELESTGAETSDKECLGTYKLRKVDLQKQGFDLAKCGRDPVFYWDSAKAAYALLDKRVYEDLMAGGNARF